MKKLIILTLITFITISLKAQTPTGKHLIKYSEINTTKSDYSLTFINDNKVIFAMPRGEKSNGGRSDLFIGDVGNQGEISNKELVKGIKQLKKISKTGIAYSNDFKTVYFSAKKDRKKKSKEKEQLFKATIDDAGNWINITKLPFNDSKYSTGQPTLSSDGKKLYFVSNRRASFGGKDIFAVTINDDGTYGEPVNLGDKINTTGDEVTPFITDDNILYYSSNGRSDSTGNLDVYASEIFENTVSESFHLDSPINSINDDFAYIINKKNNAGYFSSNRLQGQDNNDIYSFILEDTKPEKCIQEIAGIVRDKQTNEILNDAAMTLFDEDGNQIEQIITDSNGAYKFTLECNKTYTLIASGLYYNKEEHIINTANYINAPRLEANKFLTKKSGAELAEAQAAANGNEVVKEDTETQGNNTKEDTVTADTNVETEATINPVYFGFDKSNITSESARELDKLVKILKKNTVLKVEVAAYTDSRGSNAYNLQLSNRRAKSTIDYLVSKGIKRSRLKGKGFGERKMVNHCVNGVQCSEQAHAKNRRTEITFINPQAVRIFKNNNPTQRVALQNNDTSKSNTVKQTVKKKT